MTNNLRQNFLCERHLKIDGDSKCLEVKWMIALIYNDH